LGHLVATRGWEPSGPSFCRPDFCSTERASNDGPKSGAFRPIGRRDCYSRRLVRARNQVGSPPAGFPTSRDYSEGGFLPINREGEGEVATMGTRYGARPYGYFAQVIFGDARKSANAIPVRIHATQASMILAPCRVLLLQFDKTYDFRLSGF